MSDGLGTFLFIDDDDLCNQMEAFMVEYDHIFGVDLTEDLLAEMALSCFMEDVQEGRMDIIGLADRFDFIDEQMKITPTEAELNKKLNAINEGGL